MITIYNIFDKASQKQIFDYYLSRYSKGKPLKSGELILSPLRNEKSPSFNIFKNGNDWLFKDYAGETGNCFKFVELLFSISFPEALKKINEDMNLGIEAGKRKKITNIQNPKASKLPFIEKKEWEKFELDYLNPYGISLETLTKYDVSPLKYYKAKSKSSGNTYGEQSSPEKIIICYPYGEGCSKIYKPLDRKFRFLFLGVPNPDFIFGLKELPEKGDLVLIAAGEKDLLSLASHGFNVITLKSESAFFPPELLKDLQSRFKEVVLIYDNDEPGMKFSEKTAKTLGIKRVIIPNREGIKDASDFFKNGGTKEGMLELIRNAEAFTVESRLKGFRQLALEGENLQDPKKVFGEFILENQLVLFPSERGLGKTFLMLQLCIAISHGLESFCDEPLEVRGNTLYINFEMGENPIKRRLKDLIKYSSSSIKNLETNKYEAYCTSPIGDLKSNLDNIKEDIKEVNPVLVVIDNLRAAFRDKDNEKNKEMASEIMRLVELKNEFGFSLVLVHHTKKGTSNLKTNSDMQSGAGALTDLVDADFFMRRSTQDKSYRLLKRMKSRDAEEQEGACLIQLNFETMWFEFLDREVSEEKHLYEGTDNKSEQKQLAKKLQSEGLTMEAIGQQLGAHKGTISRWLNPK